MQREPWSLFPRLAEPFWNALFLHYAIASIARYSHFDYVALNTARIQWRCAKRAYLSFSRRPPLLYIAQYTRMCVCICICLKNIISNVCYLYFLIMHASFVTYFFVVKSAIRTSLLLLLHFLYFLHFLIIILVLHFHLVSRPSFLPFTPPPHHHPRHNPPAPPLLLFFLFLLLLFFFLFLLLLQLFFVFLHIPLDPSPFYLSFFRPSFISDASRKAV